MTEEERKAAVDRTMDDLLRLVQKHREEKIERFVENGKGLMRLRLMARAQGERWGATCRDVGVSPRAALNWIMLAHFRHSAPRLFARLKCLGLRKLYRLARLGPARAAQLYPEAADA